MTDRRCHRGPHPDDARLFALESLPAMRDAVHDLGWLLTRFYAISSSVKLVGDRYRLEARQRLAVSRCSCGDHQKTRRADHRLDPRKLAGRPVWIDGFNVLTTLETALAGGVLIRGRDGCIRDMASMHGSYRQVVETRPAIDLLGTFLDEYQVGECHWFFDQSVSNSGRLRQTFLESARRSGWNWVVELVPDPDPILRKASVCVATADSQILDDAGAWVSLASEIVLASIPDAWILDLAPDRPSTHGT